MKKITMYTMAASGDTAEFLQGVNDMINDGYQPYGPIDRDGYLIQPMVKYGEEPKTEAGKWAVIYTRGNKPEMCWVFTDYRKAQQCLVDNLKVLRMDEEAEACRDAGEWIHIEVPTGSSPDGPLTLSLVKVD